MLENKKIKAEMLRIQAAKAELEYLVEQKLEEIKRLEDAIKKQDLAELALQDKISKLN